LQVPRGLPTGKSSIVLEMEPGGTFIAGGPDITAFRTFPIECFTYKPEHWSGERMILVHHGVLRNADEYRDHAVILGDRFDALVVAPRFDKERFPNIKYQRGGILNEDGSAADPSAWTYAFIPRIAAQIRAIEDGRSSSTGSSATPPADNSRCA
jgi:hypothetical protein